MFQNISTVPEIALNSSQLSNATSSTVVGSNTPKASNRSDDIRSMFQQLKEEISSTNETVRNMQEHIYNQGSGLMTTRKLLQNSTLTLLVLIRLSRSVGVSWNSCSDIGIRQVKSCLS